MIVPSASASPTWLYDYFRTLMPLCGIPRENIALAHIAKIDSAQANHEQEEPPFLGDNYTMSILAVGDSYDLPDEQHPHGVSAQPVAADYYQPFSAYYDDNPVGTDALGYQAVIEHVAAYFADGAPQAAGAPRVDTVGMQVSGSGTVDGFRFRFTADSRLVYQSRTEPDRASKPGREVRRARIARAM